MHEPVPSILSESVLSLAQGARIVPSGRSSGRRSPTTIWRWIRQGALTPDGRRVYLQALKVGSQWVTSLQAMERFFQELTPRPDSTMPGHVSTGAERTRRARQAADRCQQAGL
jgi:hypothetical protein